MAGSSSLGGWGWNWGWGGCHSLGQAGFVGAYDSIASLVHVYEPARCALSAYSGNSLIRLRRASDDNESDFSHVSVADPELDLTAISTWLGGSDGYIVTIYDQIGNNDITQATAANQPLFVASMKNSHAGGRFNGTSHNLEGTFTAPTSQPISVYIAAKLDAAAVNDNTRRYLLCDDDGEGVWIRVGEHLTPDKWYITAGTNLAGNATNSNWNLWSVLYNGASSQFWINTVSEASGNAGANNLSGITVGAYHTQLSLFWDGDISSIIIADPSHSAAQRGAMETAINGYWSIY